MIANSDKAKEDRMRRLARKRGYRLVKVEFGMKYPDSLGRVVGAGYHLVRDQEDPASNKIGSGHTEILHSWGLDAIDEREISNNGPRKRECVEGRG